MKDLKLLRYYQSNGYIDELKTYFTQHKIGLTEEPFRIICIACIDYSDKCNVAFYNDLYDYSRRFKTEQTLSLLIRLSLTFNIDNVRELLEYSINYSKVKKRTLIYIITHLCNTINKEYYDLILKCFSLSQNLNLDECHFMSLLNYFYSIRDKSLFSKVLDSMCATLKIVSQPTAELLCDFEYYSKTKINKYGLCNTCKCVLFKNKINEKNRELLLSYIKNAANHILFNTFTNTIHTFTKVDYILDGANIGYFNQRPDLGGKISFDTIDKIVNLLETRGNTYLIVLHVNHFNIKKHSKQNASILKSWIDKKILIKTPKGLNDDWYWIYYSLYYDSKVITNDHLTDHYFTCLHNDNFRIWRELTCVRYTLNTCEVQLIEPKLYLNEINKKHIPFKINNNIQWLCPHI